MWYIYFYLDPRKPGKYSYSDVSFLYQPIYIGKGTGYRIKSHLKACFRPKTSKRFYNTLRKIQEDGYTPYYGKILTSNNEVEVWEIEKKLIDNIGRFSLKNGPLLNFKPGGAPDPTDQSYRTSDWKLRISKTLMGHSVSEETRNRIRQVQLGRKQTKQTILKRILKTTGMKRTQATKDAIGKANSGINQWKAKRYQYKLIDPNGVEHICAGNLNKFLKNNNLIYHPLRRSLRLGSPVERGKCKGWKMECI